MVRALAIPDSRDWDDAPIPILVVEVLSGSTRRRDYGPKRDFYLDDVRIPEYWIVDPSAKTIRIMRPDGTDDVRNTDVVWHPSAAQEPLTIQLAEIF